MSEKRLIRKLSIQIVILTTALFLVGAGVGSFALFVTYNWDIFNDHLVNRVLLLIAVVFLCMFLTCILLLLMIRKIVTRPIKDVHMAVRGYMTDPDSSTAIRQLSNVKVGNEIGLLSSDVKSLILTLDKQITDAKEVSVEVMQALAQAIDAKDKYTNGHSQRVAKCSKRLAEMNGKSEKECEEIYYTALLHDVGKIGIPLTILDKPGKLTNEEYAIIKDHTTKGAQILSSIKECPYLSVGARSHHERYDGYGYPDHLKGEDIPESARIIAVADAYDAMTSARSFRDAIPPDKVREEIVKGTGSQFDPIYARLMLHIIDIDNDTEMKEREVAGGSEKDGILSIGEYRSTVSPGVLITPYLTVIRITVDPDSSSKAPAPALILFDSLDGVYHDDEKEISERMYFEYGEISFDGQTKVKGALKMKTEIHDSGASDISSETEYKIEAIRIKDHARIRIFSKEKTTDVIVALPDSSRFMYIGLTGEHCKMSDIRTDKAGGKSPSDSIPRITEAVSFIDGPAGDIPNVQIDGFRTDASSGVIVKDGIEISFHTMSLPTARLVWHCPSICLYCADDGKVRGENYRELAFMRFDGESWESDPDCKLDLQATKSTAFTGWDNWKDYNRHGYDAYVSLKVEENTITISTENAGIAIRSTVILPPLDRTIYAAITGDQVAITNIRIH